MTTESKVMQTRVKCPGCDGSGIWEKNGGFVSGPCVTCEGRKFILVDQEPVNDRCCLYCNFEAKSEAGLKSHMKRMHKDVSHN